MEGTRTVTVIFRLVLMGKGSTANEYLIAIHQVVSKAEKPFDMHFMNYITAVVTDRENTMLLLQTLIDNWVDRKNYKGGVALLVRINY
jgi:hypothetical protein